MHFSGRGIRAHALRGLELYADAIEDYDTTLAFARDNGYYREMAEATAMTFALRGFCYYQLGLLDAAARDSLKAADLWPALPAAWFVLGRIFYQSGQYEQAVKHLHTALSNLIRARTT